MKRIIKEQELKNIIRKAVSEALRYDKGSRQYFPNYTGDPHSDAGKYTANNPNDYNYARNDYKWSDDGAQRSFRNKQIDNGFDIDPTNPDSYGEEGAENYMANKDPYKMVDSALEQTSGEFNNMLANFLEDAKQKYPILRNGMYMSEFLSGLRDAIDNLSY